MLLNYPHWCHESLPVRTAVIVTVLCLRLNQDGRNEFRCYIPSFTLVSPHLPPGRFFHLHLSLVVNRVPKYDL